MTVMDSSTQSGEAGANDRSLSKLALAFLAAIWLQLFAALMPTWSGGTYYSYGWVVPLLTGLMFYRRWQLEYRKVDHLAGRAGAVRRLVAGGIVLLLLVVVMRVLELSDPRWRIPLLGHSLVVLLYSGWLMSELLGTKPAKQFIFVALLAVSAVPLPSNMEVQLVEGLTGVVMESASMVVAFLGYPVEIEGAVLMIDGAALEVDDTCSGIRSFQSIFMYAVFFGEFWRLPLIGRVTLLLVGGVVAIVTNIGRVVVLTRVFVDRGQGAFESAHDTAGYGSFALATITLLLVGKYFDARDRDGAGTSGSG